jgi:hypothetical protein
MLASATMALFLLPPTTVDSSANRQVAAPCQLIADTATQYLREHEFVTSRGPDGDDTGIYFAARKDASTPSGKPLSLNRFSVRKYTLPRHLSLLKSYDFRLEGHLDLIKITEHSCDVTLRFEISAYEWVTALAVIDDGYRSQFISNGTLEKLYIDPVSDLATQADR